GGRGTGKGDSNPPATGARCRPIRGGGGPSSSCADRSQSGTGDAARAWGESSSGGRGAGTAAAPAWERPGALNRLPRGRAVRACSRSMVEAGGIDGAIRNHLGKIRVDRGEEKGGARRPPRPLQRGAGTCARSAF